jgi:hypothetical protein
MAARRDPTEAIDFALRRHFSARCTPEEREALVAIIREWDRAHPDLPTAERTSAWLAIARDVRAGVPLEAVAAEG